MMSSPLSSSMLRRLGAAGRAAVALSGVPLVAHDMWIEPTTFSPRAGQIVSVRLRVGQDLLGDPLPRDPALVNQFVVEDARRPQAGRRPRRRRSGGLRARGRARPARHRLSQQPERVEMPAEKFNQYLKEEGLDAVAALQGPPQRDRRRGARDLLALREEPGALGSAEPTRRAIGRSASRSSSSPNAIRTPCAPVRICPSV